MCVHELVKVFGIYMVRFAACPMKRVQILAVIECSQVSYLTLPHMKNKYFALTKDLSFLIWSCPFQATPGPNVRSLIPVAN